MSADLRGSETATTPRATGGSVIVGYLAAVSAAAICFGTIEIGVVLWGEGLRGLGAIPIVAFAAIIFWFVAFVTAMLPVGLTYFVARVIGIHSIFYYLFCGAATGAVLAPIFVWFDRHDDDSITFFQSYLQIAPMFVAMGACAAATFWSIAGRYVGLEPDRSMSN